MLQRAVALSPDAGFEKYMCKPSLAALWCISQCCV